MNTAALFAAGMFLGLSLGTALFAHGLLAVYEWLRRMKASRK